MLLVHTSLIPNFIDMRLYVGPSRARKALLLIVISSFFSVSLWALHHARIANDSVVHHFLGLLSFPHPDLNQARRITAQELMSRPLAADQTRVPKLLHQSWKDSKLPAKFEEWSQSCRAAHPDWEFVLWSDEDNANLVEKYAPSFLGAYVDLKSEIYRADAARNLYMLVFGGVYVDLDTECLRSYDSIFEDHNVPVIPHKHPSILQPSSSSISAKRKAFLGRRGTNEKSISSIPNAWMASTPGHPFWILPLEYVEDHIGDGGTPEDLTGPSALFVIIQNYIERYGKANQMKLDDYYSQSVWSQSEQTHARRDGELAAPQSLEVLPNWEIYPYSWDQKEVREVCMASEADFDAETCKDVLDVDRLGSYSITYWSHTWDAEKGHKTKMLKAIEEATDRPWRRPIESAPWRNE